MSIQISLLITEHKHAVMDVKKVLVLEKLAISEQSTSSTGSPNEVRLELLAKGNYNDTNRLNKLLIECSNVISVTNISIVDNVPNSSQKPSRSSSDDAKEECKKLLVSFFGESGADEIKAMGPEEAIKYSRGKVAGLIGEEAAKAFDALSN